MTWNSQILENKGNTSNVTLIYLLHVAIIDTTTTCYD